MKKNKQEKDKKTTYRFSAITFFNLYQLVNIKQVFVLNDIFDEWFNYEYKIPPADVNFFQTLINKHVFLINNYDEENLKMKFLAPILNKVEFLSLENEIQDFYNESLYYEADNFILTGETDFMVAKGLNFSEKPYFFIQEFKKGIKKGIKNDDPRPQLLAELIAAMEINQVSSMRGAFIVGEKWNFAILKKVKATRDKYQYFLSFNFDSTKITDLLQIYKNLLFIKHEIITTGI